MNIQDVKETLSAMCQAVIDERVNPLEVYAQVKELQSFTTEIINEIEGAALYEADKHNEKTFISDGYKFEKRNGGVSWEFKHIPAWNDLNKQIKDLENTYKAAYNSTMGGMILADGETGEDLVLPIQKPRKDSLVLKGIVRE